jgi:predicted negative regulator of RcsB-dependent stress response
MSYQTMLIGLVAITFVVAIGWALWQRARTKTSQQKSGDPEGRKATSDALHAHEGSNPLRKSR